MSADETTRIEALVRELSSMANYLGAHAMRRVSRNIADQIMTEHRTLQQGMVKLLVQVLIDYAQHATTDQRNQVSKEVCLVLTQALEAAGYVSTDGGDRPEPVIHMPLI